MMQEGPLRTAGSRPVEVEQLDNGLTLLAEPMDWLESVSFFLLLPAGFARDPADRIGVANFACEMVQRGCGTRDSRAFVEDLDRLGVERSCSVSGAHTGFGAAMPFERLSAALGIYADLVREPHLPGDQLEEGRLVCLQEIHAVEDDLAQRTMLELRHCVYGEPWGRSSQGREDMVREMTLDHIRTFYLDHYVPDGAILAVAGRVDWDALRDTVERLFGSWTAPQPEGLQAGERGPYNRHIAHESAQTQIAVGFPCSPYADDDYYEARGAVGVLSDGMSSRLFTEVREKEGLAYSVHASCHSLKHAASVFCYAGTSTEFAQRTLDVLMRELRLLKDGVREEELRRLKARIKSNLVMQQESSPSRSTSIAGDWYHLRRVRSLDEVGARIDRLSCESINSYLQKHPPQDFTIVTLGEEPLEVPDGVS